MSKYRSSWFSYIQSIVRKYPGLVEELEAVQAVSLTADYSGMPHTGGTASGTEAAAMRGLTGVNALDYAAVHDAVTSTRLMSTGNERIRLIDLVYWKNTRTLTGAALDCHISYRTAQRWHGDFIHDVAERRGVKEKRKTSKKDGVKLPIYRAKIVSSEAGPK